MAKVYKGWLKTREGDYFSPNTLAESLYSREGTKYDDVVKGYVQDAKIELETTQMTISQKVDDLYERLKNFDGSDSDTFYVIDGDGNIILKVDAEGGHSIDFKSLNYSLEEIGDTLDNIEIDENGVVTAKDFKNQNGDSFNSIREELSILQTDFVDKFRNLDTSDADTLYITDSDGNIIVRVDDSGVTSINYNVPGLISYVELVELVNAHYDEFAEKLDNTKELLQNNIDGVQTNLDTFTVEVNNRLKNFNGDDSDTLYITDSDGNVIAKVDAVGVSSINFNTPEANLNTIAANLIAETDAREKDVEALQLKDAEQQIEIQANATEITNIYNKIKYFSNDGTKFLVTTSSGQTIMEVTSEGATVNNVVTSQYDVNAVLAQLLAGLDKEIADREAAITNLTNHIDTSINTLQKNVDDRLKNFDGSDSDVLYITDSSGNIIARVDDTGVHSINFTTSQYDVNTTLTQLDERIIQEIKDRQTGDANVTNHVDNSINTLQKNIDDRLKNFDGSDSAILYITDAAGNIIARVDEFGVHSINFTTSQYDVNNMLSSLDARLIQEIADRVAGDNTVKKYVDDTAQTIQQSLTQTDNKVNTLIGSDPDKSVRTIANEELAAQLLSGKADADFKTLQQLAAWLEDHPEDVAAINLAIQVIQGQLGGFDETTNAVKNYIDNATNTLQQDMNNRLKNFDGSDSDTLYIVDSNNYKIAQIDKDGVRSINFISNEYDMNAELKFLGERIDAEASTRATQDEVYYNKHKDELDTHTVWDTQEHQALSDRITENANNLNTVNQTLDQKINSVNSALDERIVQEIADRKAGDATGIAYTDDAVNTLKSDVDNRLKNFDGSDSDALYITDKNNYKIAQVDKDGVTSINFISNQYNMNEEFKSQDERIVQEIADRKAADETYYKKHQDELNTHVLWDTNEHTTLQNNINANTQLINQVNETLDEKIDTTNDTINTRIDNEVSTLNDSINDAIQLHQDELNTHHVWDTEQHTLLQNNINDNRQFTVDARQELLDKIKFYENEGVNGSDTLYIVDGNGYKLAQFDVNGLKTTYVEATDFTAGNGFKFSGAMFYDLQGSITFPDGI